jgi:hypothetical protein
VSEEDATVIPGLTADNIGLIKGHLGRLDQFLAAWARSRPIEPEEKKAEPEAPAEANGAAPVKRRGGWPKGKSRKGAAQDAQSQH